MTRNVMPGVILFCSCVACPGPSDSAWGQQEMVQHARFAGESPEVPAPWQIWTATVPSAQCRITRTNEGLVVDAAGRPFAVGGVFQMFQQETGFRFGKHNRQPLTFLVRRALMLVSSMSSTSR